MCKSFEAIIKLWILFCINYNFFGAGHKSRNRIWFHENSAFPYCVAQELSLLVRNLTSSLRHHPSIQARNMVKNSWISVRFRTDQIRSCIHGKGYLSSVSMNARWSIQTLTYFPALVPLWIPGHMWSTIHHWVQKIRIRVKVVTKVVNKTIDHHTIYT